jgi:Flp pilus assembly pilin Flp
MFSAIKTASSRFIHDESGATLVEYILLVLLIAVAAVIGVGGFGSAVGYKMNNSSVRIGQALN